MTQLLGTLSLGSSNSDFGIYLRRTGLVVADMPWPLDDGGRTTVIASGSLQ
jgi:hypothetical protein